MKVTGVMDIGGKPVDVKLSPDGYRSSTWPTRALEACS
jgi:hypothetical protein